MTARDTSFYLALIKAGSDHAICALLNKFDIHVVRTRKKEIRLLELTDFHEQCIMNGVLFETLVCMICRTTDMQ